MANIIDDYNDVPYIAAVYNNARSVIARGVLYLNPLMDEEHPMTVHMKRLYLKKTNGKGKHNPLPDLKADIYRPIQKVPYIGYLTSDKESKVYHTLVLGYSLLHAHYTQYWDERGLEPIHKALETIHIWSTNKGSGRKDVEGGIADYYPRYLVRKVRLYLTRASNIAIAEKKLNDVTSLDNVNSTLKSIGCNAITMSGFEDMFLNPHQLLSLSKDDLCAYRHSKRKKKMVP